MSVNIRYPNITALKEKEQIAQIKSYLHQLVDQLNNELPTLATGDSSAQTTGTKSTSTYEVQGGELSYYELRSLIVQELQKVETMLEDLEQAKANGEFDGSDGKPGQDGHTPVKGVDYFTEKEVSAIATEAAGKIMFTLDAESGDLYYEVLTGENTNNEVEE